MQSFRRRNRPPTNLSAAGLKLGTLGGALLVVPFFTPGLWSIVTIPLRGLGVPVMLIGAFLYLVGRVVDKKKGTPAPEAVRAHQAPAMGTKLPVAASAASAASARSAPSAASVPLAPTPLRPTSPHKPHAAPAPHAQWSEAVFGDIEWRRFEAVVERLFQQAGFETKSQAHGADGGVDVWLYSRNEPGPAVSVVQCKHWQGKRVGVDKVRELRGVMAAHGVARGQFATTSTFTPDAVAFAQECGINLLDVNGLLGLIAKRTAAEQATLLAVAQEGEYWRPTCVNCGVKMLHREPRGGGGTAFWGCANFPRCRTRMPMRGATAVAAG